MTTDNEQEYHSPSSIKLTGITKILSPLQSRLGRVAAGFGVRDLAREAGVSAFTVARFERGDASVKASTIAALQAALERAGVQMIGDDGVRLRRPQR